MIDINTFMRNDISSTQGELIRILLKEMNDVKDKNPTKEFEEGIKGGICYALSMEWLRLVITGDERWKNNFGQVAGASKAELGYYKQIANNFLAYARKDVTKDFASLESDKTLFEIGTAKAAIIKDNETIVRTAEDLVNALLVNETYMIVRLILNGGGHRVATYRPNANTLYFYDPNRETVEIKEDSSDELKNKVTCLAQTLWKRYMIRESVVRYLMSSQERHE